MMNTINLKINVTQQEKEIFRLFTGACIQNNISSILRVAGGWVRDKVLGLESHDIDIAIDNMTGEQFLNQAHDYLKQNSNASGFGVTKINQEKSKHLETARVKINDFWIDLVNLRGENYDKDSRIPTITIGTPEQDAFRRDLTINSLFYNLMTEQIEDFTNLGIQDLTDGIIRTPLEPLITFQDDPLRILRTLRFASRFQFKLSDDIILALNNQEILDHLKIKVTKERIGIELQTVLQHNSIFQALSYYYKFNLFPIIFEIPLIADQTELLLKYEQSYKNCQILNNFIDEKFQVIEEIYESKIIRYYMFLTIILLPFKDIQIQKNSISNQLPSYIIREQLKFSTKDQQTVQEIINLYNDIINIYENMDFIKTIQFLKKAKHLWEIAAFLVNIQLISQGSLKDLKSYYNLKQYIYQQNFQKVFQLKLPINGNDVQNIFQFKKAGPFIQQTLDNIFIFFVQNQNLNKDQIINEISKNKDKYYQQ